MSLCILFFFNSCPFSLRAKLDNNERLLDFALKLEASCIGTVEAGEMTKDLAILTHGPR
jgi:isocitrate dehydrogenase